MNIITSPNLDNYDFLYNPSDTEEEDSVIIHSSARTAEVQALQAQKTTECSNREFDRVAPQFNMVLPTRERTPQDVTSLHGLLDAVSQWTIDATEQDAQPPVNLAPLNILMSPLNILPAIASEVRVAVDNGGSETPPPPYNDVPPPAYHLVVPTRARTPNVPLESPAKNNKPE